MFSGLIQRDTLYICNWLNGQPLLLDVMFSFCTFFAKQGCSVRLYIQLFVGGLLSYLRYLCLFAHSGVQYILCCGFFFLRLVYPMLPVSLDCPFFNCPFVFSNVDLCA